MKFLLLLCIVVFVAAITAKPLKRRPVEESSVDLPSSGSKHKAKPGKVLLLSAPLKHKKGKRAKKDVENAPIAVDLPPQVNVDVVPIASESPVQVDANDDPIAVDLPEQAQQNAENDPIAVDLPPPKGAEDDSIAVDLPPQKNDEIEGHLISKNNEVNHNGKDAKKKPSLLNRFLKVLGLGKNDE